MKCINVCGLLFLFLAGCKAVGPDYQPPTLPEPTANLPQTVEGVALVPSEVAVWWTAFDDPLLTNQIARTLAGNRSLRGAVAKVREARARLRISHAGLLPQVDANGAYRRFRNSDNTGQPYDGSDYQAGFDASWELDLMGRQRRAIEAAQASFEAECATLENVWVSLAAETARAYVQLRTVRQRLNVAQTNLTLQAQTLEILQSRAAAGLSDGLAVEQARYNMERTRSAIPSLESEEEADLNALAVLTGVLPGELSSELAAPAPIPAAAPRMLAGIPADLLRRRPDVRAAERTLAAQTARIGEAKADLYPTLKLNGSVGLETLHADSLNDWSSRYLSLGPSVSWPVFHAGSIRANIEVQSALQEQALAAYEQSVLLAMAELRDALSSYGREHARHDSLAKAARAARAAVIISQDRYTHGIADFNSVLDAQRSLQTFEEAVVVSEGAITENLIRVYKALGGGWSPLMPPTE